jgi:hypothetical protein
MTAVLGDEKTVDIDNKKSLT